MDAALMAVIAFAGVSMWTLRVALMGRRAKRLAAVVSAAEAVVFVLGISRIVGELDALDRLLGYAIGVAAGTWAGLAVDERLSARVRPPTRPPGDPAVRGASHVHHPS